MPSARRRRAASKKKHEKLRIKSQKREHRPACATTEKGEQPPRPKGAGKRWSLKRVLSQRTE